MGSARRTYAGAGYALKSPSHKNCYYVGAKIFGPGIEEGVEAVWCLTGNPDQPGLAMSVSSMAVAFSEYPDGRNTKATAWCAYDCPELIDFLKQLP